MKHENKSILVGQLGAAVGLNGEIRLVSHTADRFAIAGYKSLAFEDGSRVPILSLREQGKLLIARLKNVADRDAAEKLVNRALYIDRSELPETVGPDEFYLADLVGLEVRDLAGDKFGKVAAMLDFGGGNIVEIKPATGPSIMVPFTMAAVPEVNIAQGYLVFVPLPEVLDRDSEPQAESGV